MTRILISSFLFLAFSRPFLSSLQITTFLAEDLRAIGVVTLYQFSVLHLFFVVSYLRSI